MTKKKSWAGWLGFVILASFLQNCTQIPKSSTFDLVFDANLRVWELEVNKPFRPKLPSDAIELVNDSFGSIYEKPVGKQGRIEVTVFTDPKRAVKALNVSVSGLPGGILVQEYKLWKDQLDERTGTRATGEFGAWSWVLEEQNRQIQLQLPPERTFFLLSYTRLR